MTPITTRIAFVSILLSLLGASPALAQTAPPALAQIDAPLEELMAMELAPGMAVAVVRNGEVIYLRGFGFADVENQRPVTPDTIFYIASATKPFTATAVAILDDRQELDLDGALDLYLPRATYHKEVDPELITLRQLLTHTHGLANSGPVSFRVAFSGEHTPQLLRELLQYHGPAETGRTFRYSNIGYNVASMAMDDTLGISWKDVLHRELFKPLSMTSTSAYASRIDAQRLAQPYRAAASGFSRLRYVKADNNMHAAGGLMTTASDLTAWLKANLDHGRVDGRQVLSADALAEAHRPYAKQDSAFGPFGRTGYGLGWHIGQYKGEQMLHHFGGFSGFHAHISFLPEKGIGIAILTNTSGLGTLLAITSASLIYDFLLQPDDQTEGTGEALEQVRQQAAQMRERIGADRQRRAKRSQVLPHPLKTYAGTYESKLLGSVTFTVVDDRLEVTMGNLWSAVEVYDAERNALRVELTGGGSVLSFNIPDGTDKAAAFTHQGVEFRRIQ